MSFFKRWMEGLVKDEVRGQVDHKLSDLDDLAEYIKGKRDAVDVHLTVMEERMALTQGFLKEVERAVSVKENIETVMASQEHLRRFYWDYAISTLRRTEKYNPSADDWRELAVPFEISPEAPFRPWRIRQGLGAGIKAIKFLEGEGWGKYDMILNGAVRSWFLKRKDGNEDGAILLNRRLFLSEDDMFEIRQVEGEGPLKCALLIIMAGNKMTLFGNPFIKN